MVQPDGLRAVNGYIPLVLQVARKRDSGLELLLE
jgi:hypothetical protein